MAVLVTGGLGFLGRHLCKRLLDNEDVYCIDTARFMPNAMQYDKELRKYGNTHGHLFQWLVHTDINIAIPKLPSKIDVVYNLACTASPVRYKKHPFETLSTSTTGVFHVVQFCRENHAILLHTSTSEVYGDPLIKIQDEKYRGNVSTTGARSCYDEGKRCAETIITNSDNLLRYGIVRIFNTYGPGMEYNDGRVVPEFITKALKGEDLIVNGNGNQTRSFCYVDDTISALIKCVNEVKHLQCSIGPTNIGNPNECLSVNDLAKLIVKKTGSKSKIIHTDPADDYDPKMRRPDISRAKDILKWEPIVDLNTGLNKTIEDIKAQLDNEANEIKYELEIPQQMLDMINARFVKTR